MIFCQGESRSGKSPNVSRVMTLWLKQCSEGYRATHPGRFSGSKISIHSFSKFPLVSTMAKNIRNAFSISSIPRRPAPSSRHWDQRRVARQCLKYGIVSCFEKNFRSHPSSLCRMILNEHWPASQTDCIKLNFLDIWALLQSFVTDQWPS